MWWHILEVNAEADKTEVKKAYAQIIKGVDQDNDIDEFTKIHQAFRMAMKSFKNKEEIKEKEHIYIELSDEYINVLDRLYNSKSKRLNPKAWKDIFACMSFKEEESFAKEYIKFFNEHYLLIDEIWKLVDEHYPLGEQNEFKWKDLFNGSFSINKAEVEQVDKSLQHQYVEEKISIYYAILNKDFERALDLIKTFIDNYPSHNISKWYMRVAMALNNDQEVDLAYKVLSAASNDPMDGLYMIAGYCNKHGDFNKSKNYLSSIKDDNIYIDLLSKQNEQAISNKEIAPANRLPWTEIDLCKKKKQKLFSSGNYNKAIKLDNSGLKAILNKGGRS